MIIGMKLWLSPFLLSLCFDYCHHRFSVDSAIFTHISNSAIFTHISFSSFIPLPVGSPCLAPSFHTLLSGASLVLSASSPFLCHSRSPSHSIFFVIFQVSSFLVLFSWVLTVWCLSLLPQGCDHSISVPFLQFIMIYIYHWLIFLNTTHISYLLQRCSQMPSAGQRRFCSSEIRRPCETGTSWQQTW